MHSLINWTRVFDTLLPKVCLLCMEHTTQRHHLCAPCAKSLPILTHFCQQCAQVLTDKNAKICGKCLRQPPPYQRIYCPFVYQQPIIYLIQQLKFKANLACINLFSYFLVNEIRNNWYRQKPTPNVIIPVPLHPKRLRERGFNQALEIARPIAKQCVIPVDTQGVLRVRHTAAQSGLSAKAREQNIANAFVSKRSYQGLHVVIVDDVVTTGCTITTLCRVLQKAGAKTIEVWCCARR